LKKIISILLAFVIILSSTGICFAIHYCPMMKKTNFSLHEMKNCCSSKSQKNDCCEKKNIKIEKIKDNYTPSQISKTPNSQLSLFVLSFVKSFLFSTINNDKNDLFLSYHEPPNHPVSLIILNRTILI
jgi:hypothetical protein